MNSNIFIIIPNEKLNEISIIEEKGEWAGEFFSYTPQRFIFDNELKLCGTEYPYFNKKIEKSLSDTSVLEIRQGVRNLEWDINESRTIDDNCIIRLLKSVIELDWYAIMICDEDMEIDEELTVNNEADLILAVKKAFDWNQPRNICINNS